MNGQLKRYEDMTDAEKALADQVYFDMNEALAKEFQRYEERRHEIREAAELTLKQAGLWIDT